MEMLKPALAIFSTVASCRLPLGRPNFNFLLIVRAQSKTKSANGDFAQIVLARNRANVPRPAVERDLFCLIRDCVDPSLTQKRNISKGTRNKAHFIACAQTNLKGNLPGDWQQLAIMFMYESARLSSEWSLSIQFD